MSGSSDGKLRQAVPETYTPERKAEFILNNAVDLADYESAVREVRSMDLDPEKIPHEKPRRS